MSYYYSYTLTHPGLGRSRVLKAATRGELQQKAEAQLRIWNDLYGRQREANARRQTKANKAAQSQEAQNEAEARPREAQRTLASVQATLVSSLRSRLSFSWDNPRNRLPYHPPVKRAVSSTPKPADTSAEASSAASGSASGLTYKFKDGDVIALSGKVVTDSDHDGH